MSRFTFCLLILVSCVSPVLAQFKEGDPGGAKMGVAQAHKWKAGVVVTAVGRAVPVDRRLRAGADRVAGADGQGLPNRRFRRGSRSATRLSTKRPS